MMRTMKLKWTRYGEKEGVGLEAFYECSECGQGVMICDGKGNKDHVWPKEKVLTCFGCEMRQSKKKNKKNEDTE